MYIYLKGACISTRKSRVFRIRSPVSHRVHIRPSLQGRAVHISAPAVHISAPAEHSVSPRRQDAECATSVTEGARRTDVEDIRDGARLRETWRTQTESHNGTMGILSSSQNDTDGTKTKNDTGAHPRRERKGKEHGRTRPRACLRPRRRGQNARVD
ncbi:hypothetical protein C8R43DRAFT_1170165, partial [Mycena crocata]